MKELTNLIGLLLVIGGIGILLYQGFSYTQQEKIAQIGNINVTANTQKTVYFPPLVGIVSLVAGVALVFIGRRNGK